MSTETLLDHTTGDTRERFEALRAHLRRALFGDRLGLCVFLATVIFGSVFWRTGFVINDNWTIANTLVGVADGHLHVGEVRYAQANSPGMHLVDGKLYGRNYGHVFLALPFLWTLEGVATVADPRVAFAALWSLLVLTLAVLLGREFDHEREATLAGSALALGAFAANLAVATPLTEQWFALLALEVSTTLASAAVALLLYRLLARMHSRRAGVFAGVATVTATGFGFWANIPKRHAVVAALLLATLYCLYRSRETDSSGSAARFRALAYVWVGFVTWINAMEGLVLFVALLAVDLPTARSNDVRTLTTVAVAFGLSLVPFFLTNYLVVGSPVTPANLWPAYNGEPLASDGNTVTPGETGATRSGSDGGASSKLLILVEYFTGGLTVILQEPLRLVGTFLRSGDVAAPFIDKGTPAVELSILETTPLLGVLVAFPALAVRRLRKSTALPDRHDPLVVADVFIVLTALLFTLVYIRVLPLHAQIGVRYLLMLYPLGVYGVVRMGVVREVLDTEFGTVGWTTAGGVFIGAQLLFVYLHYSSTSGGDLLQVHAYIGLALGTVVAVWALGALFGTLSSNPRYQRAGAVCIGLALGAGTNFILLTSFNHFASAGDFVLPAARWLALRLLVA
ncbi:hypothetical protein [Halomarina litorea]|uniref:hypothetical protein n=1 Tax=Halomarina litorea TaxID=2961595 RepID=UPI0020C22D15|nr:hypothetical protein [Halomarina sp. BCD28]